jgi:hypothetical protein
MKKICSLALFFLVISSFRSTATIITVDNNYPSIGNHATLQAAHNSANDGDTLYIFPSNSPYNAISLSKRLILIGAGFEHPESVKGTSMTGTMTFNPSSQGSVIEGFDMSGTFLIVIDANNISVLRNKLKTITVNSGHTGTVIMGNFLYYVSNDLADYRIMVQNLNEVYIYNNKIFSFSYGFGGYGISTSEPDITGYVANNVICMDYMMAWPYTSVAINNNSSACEIINNIIIVGDCWGNHYSYNMCSGNQLPETSGNIRNVDMSIVFVNWLAFDFHLKNGSPAAHAGQNNDDLGIYGGRNPFIDGGYPGIPSIYYLNVPFSGSQQNGLNITIKAKSNPN